MGKTQKNKAHKARFSSKSSRRDHQLGGISKERNPKKSAPSQTAKEIRLQRSKNIRDKKRAILLAEKRGIKGDKSAPRVLALVPLNSRAETGALKQRLLSAASGENASSADGMEMDSSGKTNTSVSKHKLRITVLNPSPGDLQSCLQVSKVADVVAFVIPVTSEDDQEYIDEEGSTVLSMLKAQGLASTITIIMGLENIPAKKRSELKKLVVDCLEAQLPPNTKGFTGDDNEDSQQVLRHLSDQRPSHIQWRSRRPFVMAEQLSFEPHALTPDSGTLVLSGYVREQSLSVNQLIHVSGAGDFQLEKLCVVEDPASVSKNENMMILETNKELFPDPAQQAQLIVENEPDPLAGDQTWPTKEELALADRTAKSLKKRTLPKGTSSYQAAWIVDDHPAGDGDEDEDDKDDEPENMECGAENEEDEAGVSEDEGTVFDDDGNTSEMMDDESVDVSQTNEDIRKLKDEIKTDEEYPDEVDTPTDRPARERFARYRGLKSLRTSPWDPKESLPPEYARIFAFDNFNRTMKHVTSEKAKQPDFSSSFSVPAGTYVKLFIKSVPLKAAENLLSSYQRCPVVALGLFEHESKMSVVHFGIKKHDEYTDPLKSKDALVFHVGFRSYLTRPVFSSDDINMSKHKFERFLHPGRFSVASVFLPVQFPPAPLIVFKCDAAGNLKYAASGALKNADPDRIVLKRIVLSGYPLRVSKRKAVVRYMFHNPEDVRWFKPLELWTKYGRRGRIMEPVGTHGAMKCVFDGVVQQRDAVCVSLYKRVYPKWPENISSC